MANVRVIGVRHHSPACARLVAHVIAERQPRFVLVEGPSDMNDRMGEFLLGHQMPIALYTYRLLDSGQPSRATWSPFCDYSPELLALQAAKKVAATALFIDYPAWDEAFDEVENRYADEQLQASSRGPEIAASLGFDSTDALWDHLFESPELAPSELEPKLAQYFDALRADEPGEASTKRRETRMAEWIAWAARAAGNEPVVVICGGYHKPALERLWPTLPGKDEPQTALPADRVGSYLVPFSFQRLDSFAGYASGMPSPGYYQTLWSEGASAPERMLFRAIERLRKRGQRASTADAVAANNMMIGLAAMRGHTVPTRIDVLDALASALVKEALNKPAPWSIRASLPRGTDPILVELVDVFSGDQRGTLATGTPQPPLLDDIHAELSRVDLAWTYTAHTVTLNVLAPTPLERDRRHVLYRLQMLDLPGISLEHKADLARGGRPEESWQLLRQLEADATIVERAVFGASLRQAALARVSALLQDATSVRALATLLEQAVLAGFEALAQNLVDSARTMAEAANDFADLGQSIARILHLNRTTTWTDGAVALAELIELLVERALWLLEAIDGSTLPFDDVVVPAIVPLRDAVLHATFARRAQATTAPPAIRGALLGALWSFEERPENEARPSDAAPESASPSLAAATLSASVSALTLACVASMGSAVLGDFLAGLFVTAREQLMATPLLDAIDARITDLTEEDFLSALPGARQAFEFFPPRERIEIARKVVAKRDPSDQVDPRALVAALAPRAMVEAGTIIEREATRIAKQYGLFAPLAELPTELPKEPNA
jgi:hypothetical protein